MLAACVVIPFFIAYFFFNRQMVHLFMDAKSISAISVGKDFLIITSPFYFVVAVKLMADGVLRGSGAMKYFMITTFSDLILRVVISYVLVNFFDIIGIWLSWPIGWSVGTILSYGFYKKGVWKTAHT